MVLMPGPTATLRHMALHGRKHAARYPSHPIEDVEAAKAKGYRQWQAVWPTRRSEDHRVVTSAA